MFGVAYEIIQKNICLSLRSLKLFYDFVSPIELEFFHCRIMCNNKSSAIGEVSAQNIVCEHNNKPFIFASFHMKSKI